MKDHKSFFWSKRKENRYALKKYKTDIKRDEEGRVHLPMHTKLFSTLSKDVLATNSMYAEFKDDLESTIGLIPAKERIVMDVYETEDSSEFGRDFATIGFKKYLYASYRGFKREQMAKFSLFTAVMVIGILIEIFIYAFVVKDVAAWELAIKIPTWLIKVLETLANMFVWQYAGYMSFDFAGEVKTSKRYKQMLNTEFEFKHWE